MSARGEGCSLCPSETPAILLAALAALLQPFLPVVLDLLLQRKHYTENNNLSLGKKQQGLTETNIF